jgi:anti-sigma B factor antagonist
MMDSSGLGVLVSSYTSVQKRGGRLVLAGLGRGLQNLVAITKLTRVFDIYENEEDAVKSFKDD